MAPHIKQPNHASSRTNFPAANTVTARCIALLALFSGNATFAADAKPNAWQGDVEAGMILSEGNTSAKTIKTGLKATYDATIWRHSGNFESLTAEQDDESTAEKYFAEAKTDYKFSEHNYLFAYAGYTDDRFTDFDYQASAALGYGRLLLENASHRWDAEIGPGYRLTEYEAGYNDEETITHVASTYTWKISATSRFEQTLLVESGADNTVTRAKSALIAKINNAFSMKLGYTLTYNQEVPQDTEHADKETSVSLLYSF